MKILQIVSLTILFILSFRLLRTLFTTLKLLDNLRFAIHLSSYNSRSQCPIKDPRACDIREFTPHTYCTAPEDTKNHKTNHVDKQ